MNALEIIAKIEETTGTDTKATLAALCDGEALAAIGVTDDDQEAVEEAYAIITEARVLELAGY